MTRGLARWADLALVFVALGVVLRVQAWLPAAPLWLDEQMIAVNLRDSGFVELAGRLSYFQVAPLGWLWVEHAVLLVLDDSERVLRLFPLLCGIATLVVAWLLGRRWLGAAGTIVFVGLCAVAPTLVRYSAEVKPYSGDALWVLVLVGLAAWTLETRWSADRPPRTLAVWWGAAAVAGWLSLPAIIVAPGLALVLLVVAWRRHGRGTALRGALLGVGLWGVPIAVHYGLSLRASTATDPLKPYWRSAGGLPDGNLLTWLADRPAGLAANPMAIESTVGGYLFWGLVLAGLGLAWWWRPAYGALLTVPLATGLTLGALGLVPLASRLALWLVPTLLLAVSVVVTAVSRTPRVAPVAAPVAALACGALLFVPQFALTTRHGPAPDRVDDRAAVGWLAQRLRADDLIVVTISSAPGIVWYGRHRLRPGWYVRDVAEGERCTPADFVGATRGYRRILAYAGARGAGVQTPRLLEESFGQLGRIVERGEFDQGVAWVVELNATPPEPASVGLAGGRCLRLEAKVF